MQCYLIKLWRFSILSKLKIEVESFKYKIKLLCKIGLWAYKKYEFNKYSNKYFRKLTFTSWFFSIDIVKYL